MRWLVSMALLLAACGGGGASARTRSRDGEARRPGLPEGPLPLPAVLAVLPGNSASLVGIDGGQARASVYYKDYAELLTGALSDASALVVHPCFDLAAKADQVVGAVGIDPARPDQTLLVFSMSYSRDQLRECARGAGNLTVTDDNDLSRYQLAAEVVHVRWLSTHTFAVAGDHSAAALAAIGGRGGRADDNRALMDLVGKTRTEAMAWFAVYGANNPMLSQNLTVGDQPPAGAYGWVNLPDRLDAKFAVTFASDDAAVAAEKQFRAQLDEASHQPLVGSYVSALALSRSGRDVELAVAMPAGDVSGIIQMMKLAL